MANAVCALFISIIFFWLHRIRICTFTSVFIKCMCLWHDRFTFKMKQKSKPKTKNKKLASAPFWLVCAIHLYSGKIFRFFFCFKYSIIDLFTAYICCFALIGMMVCCSFIYGKMHLFWDEMVGLRTNKDVCIQIRLVWISSFISLIELWLWNLQFQLHFRQSSPSHTPQQPAKKLDMSHSILLSY